MQKSFKLLVGIFALFVATFLISTVSAYGYGYNDGYKQEYYEKSSYDWNGHSYVKRTTVSDPWGSHTTYISDRNYEKYSPYANQVNDYWHYGYTGHINTNYYVNYDYDDAYRRSYDYHGSYNYGSQYHPYYYDSYAQPYNGYYDWSYRDDNAYRNWRAPSQRCNNVYACNW